MLGNFIVALLLVIGTATAASQEATGALMLGTTTYEEASATWVSTGAAIGQRGNLAVGAGSGADRLGQYAVKEVLLVDVSGMDFEGLKLARYGFVDGTLYSITARLDSVLPQNRISSNELSSSELGELEKRLREKYGKPSKALKDLLAGTAPNILVWDLKELELVLHIAPGLGSSLQLRHKSLTKKAEGYRTAECRKHRPACAA